MQTFKDSKLLPFVTALLGDAQFDGSPVLVIALHSTTRKRELYSYHGERIHYLAQTTGSLVGPPVDELMITSFQVSMRCCLPWLRLDLQTHRT